MRQYKDRILEIHGYNMWNMFHVDRAIKFAHQYHMTGIIFHCNDLVDRMVFPEKYFTKDELLSYNPVRNSITKSYRYYLRSVIDKCKEYGLDFFVEVKEIYFTNDLLSKYPQLRKSNGQLCATDPFWWEYLEEKYNEFFSLFPDVAGVSVSPGTRESMVSFAANRCDCERCKNYDVDLWYHNVLDAMYKSVSKAGKRLIVRDFSYTKKHQFAMVDAASSVSDNITMSMKMVPHDYYPVFPENPAIGNTGNLGQWVEYDAWGQFFSLGVFPCSVAEDTQRRMISYFDKGVTGITLRTDWENMAQSSTFCSFNMLNLIAGAMISYDLDTSLDEVYSSWAKDYGLVSPLIQDSFPQVPYKVNDDKSISILREIMTKGWLTIEKALHVRGHVFNRNAQVFDRYDLPYNIMTVFHSRDQWEPGASKRVEPNEENIPVIIEEKEEALALSKEVANLCDNLSLSVTDENIKKYLQFLSKAFILYVEGFKLEAETLMYSKMVELGNEDYRAKAMSTLDKYDDLAKEYKNTVAHKGYSGIVEYILDGDRLLRYKKAVIDALGEA